MDTSGYFPQLSNDDPLFEIAQYTQLLKATLDKSPRGLLLEIATTNVSGGIGSLTVVNNIASFAFKAGRKYRIVWDTDWYGDSADTTAAFSISTASTLDAAGLTTGLTQLGIRNSQARTVGISSSTVMTAYYKPVSDSTVQVKFLAAIDGSGSTLHIQGNRTGAPSRYQIYDDGAQF